MDAPITWRDKIETFDQKKIEENLIREAGASPEVAEEIASEVWKELKKFIFSWDGVSGLPEIEVFAWDHDYIGSDDFIGYARVQLHPTMFDTEVKVPLEKKNKKDKKQAAAWRELWIKPWLPVKLQISLFFFSGVL